MCGGVKRRGGGCAAEYEKRGFDDQIELMEYETVIDSQSVSQSVSCAKRYHE